MNENVIQTTVVGKAVLQLLLANKMLKLAMLVWNRDVVLIPISLCVVLINVSNALLVPAYGLC